MPNNHFSTPVAILGLAVLLSQAPAAEAKRPNLFGGKTSSEPTSSTSTAFLSLDVNRAQIDAGESVVLSWAALNVRRCMASGDWSGRQRDSGFFQTRPLTQDANFTLTCTASSGNVEQTVRVAVRTPASVETVKPVEPVEPVETSTKPTEPVETVETTTRPTEPVETVETTTRPTEPVETVETTKPTEPVETVETTKPTEPVETVETTKPTEPVETVETTEPTSQPAIEETVAPPPPPTGPSITPVLQLQASASAVRSGESVTLDWRGEAVSNCQASGAWSGPRASSGSELRGGLTASETYTLTCDSAQGQIMAMTSVQVSSGGTQLTWRPPQQNVDGSPLTDLAAYRIYVGTISQQYYEHIDLQDPSLTQHFVDLLPGEYFIAMTALDGQGNESSFSNEVYKVVE